MQITLATQPFAALETEALVSYVFEETDPVQGRIAELDQAAAGLLRKLAKSGELTGKMLEFTLVHAPAGLKAARLLLVGVGKREQYSIAALRKVAGAALRHLMARSVKNLAFLVREGHAAEESAKPSPKACSLAISRRTNTRPKRKTTSTSKLSCSLVPQTPNVRRQRRAFRKAASSPRRKTSL